MNHELYGPRHVVGIFRFANPQQLCFLLRHSTNERMLSQRACRNASLVPSSVHQTTGLHAQNLRPGAFQTQAQMNGEGSKARASMFPSTAPICVRHFLCLLPLAALILTNIDTGAPVPTAHRNNIGTRLTQISASPGHMEFSTGNKTPPNILAAVRCVDIPVSISAEVTAPTPAMDFPCNNTGPVIEGPAESKSSVIHNVHHAGCPSTLLST